MKAKTASKQVSQVSLNLAEFDSYPARRSPSQQPAALPQTVRSQLPPLGIKLAKVDWSEVMKRHGEQSQSVDLDPVRASFFCDKAVEEAKTDLSRLYYNESSREKQQGSPAQVKKHRKLRAVSLSTSYDEKQPASVSQSQAVSPVKMASLNVRLGLTEVVDEMELRLLQVRRASQGLDGLEQEFTELTTGSERLDFLLSTHRSERVDSMRRVLQSYKQLLGATLRQYRQDHTNWQLRSALVKDQRPQQEEEAPYRFDPLDQIRRHQEAKKKLQDLETFINADGESYEKFKNSVLVLLQTTSSGTTEYLNNLYKEMSRTRTLPENLPLQLPNLRLSEWEGELRSRFK